MYARPCGESVPWLVRRERYPRRHRHSAYVLSLDSRNGRQLKLRRAFPQREILRFTTPAHAKPARAGDPGFAQNDKQEMISPLTNSREILRALPKPENDSCN